MYERPRCFQVTMIRLTCLLVLALTSPTARAQTVAGTAQIVDGDTLTIDGQRIRLFGIDAPESDQSCVRRGEHWDCGATATEQLRSLTVGTTVSCEQQDIDQYGRIVAICRAGRYDLGRTMVEYGYATAFRRYSDIYVDDELRAHAARTVELNLRTTRATPPNPASDAGASALPSTKSATPRKRSGGRVQLHDQRQPQSPRRVDLPFARQALLRSDAGRRTVLLRG